MKWLGVECLDQNPSRQPRHKFTTETRESFDWTLQKFQAHPVLQIRDDVGGTAGGIFTEAGTSSEK